MSTSSRLQSSRGGGKTKYEKLARRMEQCIRDGEFRPGDALPTVRQLMASSNLGNATVAKSMELLERRGLVHRHPQRGYFVAASHGGDTRISHIAYISPNLSGDSDLITSGIREILDQDRDYSLSVYSTNSNIGLYQKTIDQMPRIRPAGIVLASLSPEIYRVDASPISEARIPTVILYQRVEGFIRDRVDYRGRESALKLGRYLLDRGSTDFAFLTVDLPNDPSRLEFIETIRRMLAEQGQSLPENRIYRFVSPYGCSRTPDSSVEAQECMRRVLASGDPPKTLVCCHDNTAVGALRAIQEAGLRVPDDIQVASIATTSSVTVASPRLTTIQAHHKEWGRLAGELLLKRMEGYDGEYEVHYVGGDLIVGETTK